MRIAIMQPYFFPYIGYFQLMSAVDKFVIYDNIQFTKKGWINRNRILVNGDDSFITIPLKKDSDYLDVRDRQLSPSWLTDRRKMVNRVKESYRRAPNFDSIFPVIESIILFEEENLFKFLFNSLIRINEYLSITTPLTISSTIAANHDLKSAERVISICKIQCANQYLNPIGGIELYSKENFENNGIQLQFIKTGNIEYPQLNNKFVPMLSIVDVMMFNSKDRIIEHLNSSYTIH